MSFLRPIASLFYGVSEDPENDATHYDTENPDDVDGSRDPSDSGEAEIFSVSGSLFSDSSRSRKCLFLDAQLILFRKDTQIPSYDLIVSRIVDDDEDEDPGDDGKNYYVFEVNQNLRFHSLEVEGEDCLRWKDPKATTTAYFSFTFPGATPLSVFKSCRSEVLRAIFETKHKRSGANASLRELEELAFIPGQTSTLAAVKTSSSPQRVSEKIEKKLSPLISEDRVFLAPEPEPPIMTGPISSLKVPKMAKSNLELDVEFFSFDTDTMMFTLCESKALVTLWYAPRPLDEYYLSISGPRGDILVQILDEKINHGFHVSDMAFVWNFFSDTDGKDVYSFSITFTNASEFTEFRRKFTEDYMQATLSCALDSMNLAESDINYIMSQNESTPLVQNTKADSDDSSSDSGPEETTNNSNNQYRRNLRTGGHVGAASRRRSSGAPPPADGERNTQLQVSRDRAFAVRGSNVGVFGFDREGQVVYNNTIHNLTFDRRAVRPAKALLHDGGRKMIFTDENRSDRVFELDLDVERVVREWMVAPEKDENGTISIRDLTQSTKDGQASQGNERGEFVAVSDNALFAADTRMPDFVNWENSRVYKTPVNLRCAATTASGAVAVGSDRGELRLFDRVGPIAKTNFQGATEPFRSIDVSDDGRFVLATFFTHLLLYDVEVETKKGEQTTAFLYRMPKEGRPRAIRLQLRPEHVALLGGKPVHFTPAKLRSGVTIAGSTIVTSTGPFVITWGLRDVLGGRPDKYVLKKMNEDIVAEAFKLDDGQKIVLATTQDVTTVSEKELKPVRGRRR